MTMSRQTIRHQMQGQNPMRKRQLYEVAPSPPKKWMRFMTSDSPASSPSNSPAKGPLLDHSDDESVPTFRPKSFYGLKRKSLSAALSREGNNSSPPAAPAAGKMSVHGSVSSCESASSDDEKSSRSRPALSPIKNIMESVKKGSKRKSSQAAVTGRRQKSRSAKTLKGNKKKENDGQEKTLVKSVAPRSSPVKGHKFFKHKSPASASKAVGGIIIKKGFNLKFVRDSLGRGFGLSPGKKAGPAAKPRSTPKVQKTYSRNNSKSDKTAKETDSAISFTGSDLSMSSGNTSWQVGSVQTPVASPHLTSSLTTPESSTPSSLNEESDSLSSQYVPGSDTQSLSSDVSGPVHSRRPGTRMSTLQSTGSSGNDDMNHLFSIFRTSKRSQRHAGTENSPEGRTVATVDLPQRKYLVAKKDDKQLMLDAGQEKFGARQCRECGMVYSPGDGADEATHAKFHQSAITALKFPGWKKEHVLKEFLDDGSRVIVVRPEDQRFMVKKVEEVNKVMGQELGFSDQVFSFHGSQKAFLYISDEKRVEGCCIAESVTQGYRVLPNSRDLSDLQRPWLCSTAAEPASVGIGRLWVYGPSRKRGVASRLLDCIRQWFEYGIMMEKSQLAFSDPTPDGRRFAAKYTGTVNFLVYKYNH